MNDRKPSRWRRILPLLLADAAKPYIGGQAVLEGVMMRSPGSFVVAVRKPDGGIAVRAEPWDNLFTRYRLFRLPLLRGAVVLIESLWNGFAALNFSAEHAAPPEEGGKQGEKPSQAAIGATLALSLAFGLGLFVGVPHLLTWGIGQLVGHPLDTTQFAFHALDGALRLVIFLVYLGLISRLPDIRRVFQFHGAEHKAIWAYEKGTKLSVDDAEAQTTLHPRCGTSFLLLVVGVSIVLFATVFPMLPRLATSDLANTLLLLGVKLPLMIPVAGLSYEIQRLSAKRPRNPILRALTGPGLWLQRITTKEPTRDQLEIALIAMRRCIAYEEGRLNERGVTLYQDFDGALAIP
ncbi:DUF1385 domain-containing protein [Vulgatibacter incomptus]|uniref:DUF1385 domain-containing protein n=1 Tax=Vulgatibacter incomptus TaxID=1391653 RepID=A0A0K1PDC1_9BACT|nr:DUF1385 domain-containing protein [Vulgatibacter incomptus]AKU91401.1 hypothetical protein AKJ08_1788 [Vulgatibacter incomptus]